MNVNSVGNGSAVQKVYPTIHREIPSDASAPATTADHVELSGQAQAVGDGIRADKVAAVKAQIAAGTYETDDKVNAAVNNMLDEVIS